MSTVKPGDFTQLASDYARYRSGYADSVADALCAYVGASRAGFAVADVGAGTGIWTSFLAERGLACIAVEPNDAMRAEGTKAYPKLTWRAGRAEKTGLECASVNWVTMASSFHWAETEPALHEFARILKPGGFFTALWNPRDIQGNALHEEIEAIVYRIVPNLRRVSSGSKEFLKDLELKLISSGHFRDVLYMEARHKVSMTPERYVGVWRSVNDIQAQAGPERFDIIIDEIRKRVASLKEVLVPYLTRAWTVRTAR